MTNYEEGTGDRYNFRDKLSRVFFYGRLNASNCISIFRLKPGFGGEGYYS